MSKLSKYPRSGGLRPMTIDTSDEGIKDMDRYIRANIKYGRPKAAKRDLNILLIVLENRILLRHCL